MCWTSEALACGEHRPSFGPVLCVFACLVVLVCGSLLDSTVLKPPGHMISNFTVYTPKGRHICLSHWAIFAKLPQHTVAHKLTCVLRANWVLCACVSSNALNEEQQSVCLWWSPMQTGKAPSKLLCGNYSCKKYHTHKWIEPNLPITRQLRSPELRTYLYCLLLHQGRVLQITWIYKLYYCWSSEDSKVSKVCSVVSGSLKLTFYPPPCNYLSDELMFCPEVGA